VSEVGVDCGLASDRTGLVRTVYRYRLKSTAACMVRKPITILVVESKRIARPQ
jgi:hypothetical protein